MDIENADILSARFSQFLQCCGLEMIEVTFQNGIGFLGEVLISIKCAYNGKGYQEIIQEMYDREAVIARLENENKILKEKLDNIKTWYKYTKKLIIPLNTKDGNECLNKPEN